MTTTKEDQIRAKFEKMHLTIYGNFSRNLAGTYHNPHIEARWDTYKACAESYEKKLAMLEAEVLRLDAGWQEANQRALKYGLEIAELKELHAIELAGVNEELDAISEDTQTLANDLHRTEVKLSEAKARNAMLVDAITKNHQWHIFYDDAGDYEGSELWNENTKAVTANSEAVATWEAEKLEPLRREVMMLRDAIKPWTKYGNVGTRDIEVAKAISAFDNTQATAEAYEREVAANALDTATYRIEQRAGENSFYANHAPTFKDAVDDLKLFSAELRAANKGKEIV